MWLPGLNQRNPALRSLFYPSRQLAIFTQPPRSVPRTCIVAIHSVIQRFLEGDQSQSRGAKELLNILWSLERVVHLFLNEGSARGTAQPQNQSYGQIENDPRLDRRCG